jgi:hypothetical protein
MTQNKQMEVQLKYAPRYNLVAQDTQDGEAINKLLEEGYEPFAVTNTTVQVKNEIKKIAVAGEQQTPFTFQNVTTIWFRQLVQVPLVQELTERKLDVSEK